MLDKTNKLTFGDFAIQQSGEFCVLVEGRVQFSLEVHLHLLVAGLLSLQLVAQAIHLSLHHLIMGSLFHLEEGSTGQNTRMASR